MGQSPPCPDPGPARASGRWGAFAQQFYRIWVTERPIQFAAALAYYAIFSFVPAIYVAFVLADLFLARLSVAEWFYAEATRLLGEELALVLQDAVTDLANRTAEGTRLATLIGSVALVFTASVVFFQLQHVLNTLWRVPPPEKGGTRALIRDRLLAFGVLVAIGPLFVIAAVLDLVLSVLSSFLGLPSSLPLITFAALAGLGTLCFALLYKVLPHAKVAWRDVWLGAAVTAVPITVVVSLAGVFVGTSRVRSALDAAGAMAVFLLGFFVLGQIFCFGAIFTRVYASVFGSQIRSRDDGTPIGGPPGREPEPEALGGSHNGRENNAKGACPQES